MRNMSIGGIVVLYSLHTSLVPKLEQCDTVSADDLHVMLGVLVPELEFAGADAGALRQMQETTRLERPACYG